MMYAEAIEAIMPDVRGGSMEPFWITRSTDGSWDVRRDDAGGDPFAIQLNGAGFDRGSFPFVYDKVFTARLRKECEQAESLGGSTPEMTELVELFEDYASEFSSVVTDYLAEVDRPLEALCRMNVLGADANAVIDRIEGIVENRMGMAKNEPVSNKRSIEGYTERLSLSLAARVVVLAGNPKAADPYLICNIRNDNPFGLEERYNGVVTADYLEAVQIFADRINELAQELAAEREQRGLPITPLTIADCIPGGLNEHLEGKVIIIDPKALAPEYRSADHQLKICTGGFGAAPNARGSAVFCKDLYTGKQTRFERCDVLGVANIERIPEWAKNNLNIMLPPDKKPSILGKLGESKQKVERDKVERKDKPTKKRYGELEV